MLTVERHILTRNAWNSCTNIRVWMMILMFPDQSYFEHQVVVLIGNNTVSLVVDQQQLILLID
jgi:hypothetical protein